MRTDFLLLLIVNSTANTAEDRYWHFIAKQDGVFIHVSYGVLGQFKKAIPFAATSREIMPLVHSRPKAKQIPTLTLR
jgi:hypothetical protein